jgi:serine/threonine-protein kinase
MTETQTGELKGKLSYIAPEQILRRGIDRRTDVWSLAVVSWEVLAGRRLFSTDNEIETLRNVDSMPIPWIGAIAKGLPQRTSDAIMRCLSRDPDERLATAALLGAALREGSVGLSPPTAEGTDALAARRAYVHRLLATEMAVEGERLAAAVRTGPPPPFRNLSAEEEISDPFRLMVLDETRDHSPVPAMPTDAPKRRWLRSAAAVTAAFLAGVTAWAIVRGSADEAPQAVASPRVAAAVSYDVPPVVTRTEPAPPPPPTVETPVEPEPVREIEVVLDPRIRTVTVDGRPFSTRPVRLEIGASPVIVEGESATGERTRRIVDGAGPRRVALMLPRAPTEEEAPPATRKTKLRSGSSPLLDSPYGRRPTP